MLVFITYSFSELKSISTIAIINYSSMTMIIVYSLLVASRNKTYIVDAL